MISKNYKKSFKTHTFVFKKITTYDFDPADPDRNIFLAKQYESLLIELKNENFNRIKIPDYTVKRNNNVVTVNMQFIKGTQLNHLNKNLYKQIILEDLVLRLDVYGDRKTFHDYALKNFIIENDTEQLYYVDLEHYGKLKKPLHQQIQEFNLRFGN